MFRASQNEAVALTWFRCPRIASVPPLGSGTRAKVLVTGSSDRAVHEPCCPASFAHWAWEKRCKRVVGCTGSRRRLPAAQISEGLALDLQGGQACIPWIASPRPTGWSVGLGRDVSGGSRRSGHDNSKSSQRSPANPGGVPGNGRGQLGHLAAGSCTTHRPAGHRPKEHAET